MEPTFSPTSDPGEDSYEESVQELVTFCGPCTCIHTEAEHGVEGCEATTDNGECPCSAHWANPT